MTQELFGPVWTPVLLALSVLLTGFSGLVLWRSAVLAMAAPRAQKTQDQPRRVPVLRATQLN